MWWILIFGASLVLAQRVPNLKFTNDAKGTNQWTPDESENHITDPTWDPKHLRKRGQWSFTGSTLDKHGRLPGFDISGHARPLAETKDFLRVVQPQPTAFGGLHAMTPYDSTNWVVEIGFRVHGPEDLALDESSRRWKKGGRGWAFWYTKDGPYSPTVTIPGTSSRPIASPPTLFPRGLDSNDQYVSLFGSRSPFDGLGIIFDTTPDVPLYFRSLRLNQAPFTPPVGKVVGILDDGKTADSWIDDHQAAPRAEHAKYASRAFGECDAAFRNSPGVLYARIAYYNNTLRVDLDQSSHTTRSRSERQYLNCVTLEGISLPPGNVFAITGLAAGGSTPDAVDIYSMETYEVDPTMKESPQPITEESRELYGVQDAQSRLLHELMVQSAINSRTIQDVHTKVEGIMRDLGRYQRQISGTATDARLRVIDQRLEALSTAFGASKDERSGQPAAENWDAIKGSLDKLESALKAIQAKQDSSFRTITNRGNDSWKKLTQVVDLLSFVRQAQPSLVVLVFSVAIVGTACGYLGILLWDLQHRHSMSKKLV